MVRSILHKDFLQEKYETLQERDVNPVDCLKTVRGVDYTNWLPYAEALPQNCQQVSQKCKSHAHFQGADNICPKFQVDCLKILGGDYTNFF